MIDLGKPLTEKELYRLSAFLNSVGNDATMDIEELDGFLCALVVGPELVMPSEYWPHILGREPSEGVFKTKREAERIMSLVIRHWNSIVATLRAAELHVPVILANVTKSIGGQAWAIGFLRGVELREESWREFLDDKELSVAVQPMLILASEGRPDRRRRFKSPSQGNRTELIAMMAEGLNDIYEYFQGEEETTPAHFHEPIVRSAPKIGRNDPCPCGSGKKYKQCCGQRLH